LQNSAKRGSFVTAFFTPCSDAYWMSRDLRSFQELKSVYNIPNPFLQHPLHYRSQKGTEQALHISV